MSHISRFVGGVLVLAVLWWSGIGAGGFHMFYDLPSMIMVTALTVGGVLIAHGWGGIRQVFSRDGDCKLAVAVLTSAHQFAWGAGLLSTFVGLIMLLQNMADPPTVGPGIAVGLLPLLYAAVLAEFIISPVRRARASGDGPPGDTSTRPVSMPVIAAVCVLMVFSLWGVLAIAAP